MQPKYNDLTPEQKQAWIAYRAEWMESDMAKYIMRRIKRCPVNTANT